jgi:uncharacterized protein YoxC
MKTRVPAPIKKALKELLLAGAKILADRQVTTEEFDELVARVKALADAVQAHRRG